MQSIRPRLSDEHRLGRNLVRWVVLCAVGELVGIAAGAAWYGFANVTFGEPRDLGPRLVAWAAMTLAAAPETLVLGGMQLLGFRPFWPVGRRAWLLATLCVGLIGWGIGGAIPLFLIPAEAAPMAASAEPTLLMTAVFASLFGLAAGALFGGFQALALPKRTVSKRAWVLANLGGWGLGLPAIYVGAQLGADTDELLLRLACWGVGGLVAGACVGLATAAAIWASMRRPATTSGAR